MKLFRFRFIILGLLLCIFHVWCRTCGTVFTDPASSTYLAQIVIEGTVSQKLPYGDLYSLRVYVKKVRKGDQYLPQGKKTRTLIIGDFSDTVNQELCITNITADKQQKYFFFIKNTTRGYVSTALPIESNKKTARDVRKLACRTCDKAPVLKTIKVKPIIEGKKNTDIMSIKDSTTSTHIGVGERWADFRKWEEGISNQNNKAWYSVAEEEGKSFRQRNICV